MKTIFEALLTVAMFTVLFGSLVITWAAIEEAQAGPPKETCFFDSAKVDGLTKICYYSCTCGTKALNLKSYEVCPVTANFSCY